jgi:hypothetical protein
LAKTHPNQSEERGIVAMAAMFFMTTMVLAMGLILDGGRIYSGEQDAARDASAAARAAAQQPDENSLLNDKILFKPGTTLDSPEDVARKFLVDDGGYDAKDIVVSFFETPEGTSIHVEVKRQIPMLILQMIPGMKFRTVGGSSNVRLRTEVGIDTTTDPGPD